MPIGSLTSMIGEKVWPSATPPACDRLAVSVRCSGRSPSSSLALPTWGRYCAVRSAGTCSCTPAPRSSLRPLPESSRLAGIMFIAGEPMKPATNLVRGL